MCDLPLQLDSSNPDAIQAAIRLYNGVPMINSVNGGEESMSRLLPIIARYQCPSVTLPLDERGVPETTESRIEIAQGIIKRAESMGIDRRLLVFDGLVMAISSNQQYARITINTLTELKKLGVLTTVGLSNVSFGLPDRGTLNRNFLAMALMGGLDMPIMNPLDHDTYNNLFKDRKLNPEKGHRYLPYIVVVIDEFGDLIMTAGKDIEMPIARIAQKARAVGMHMIIATQRPTTNIITGTIKANFPARMAFRVSSMIDSRTILDRPGANQLIGRGDLLFLSGSDPVRVQCAFVDTPEVNAICQYISRQQGYTEAYPLPEYVDENEGGAIEGGVDMGKFDPMFAEAARLVVVNQSGSTSLIQRKFSIGYNRAGRLMDQLEATGIVGRADGSKPRPVLVADEVQLDRILETYNLL